MTHHDADDAPVRGTCPCCGGEEVLHHLLGMPLPEAMESAPPWVVWDGCMGLGPDRECTACGFTWSRGDVGHPGADAHGQLLRVVGAVLVDGGGVLAARRAPGRSAAGLWEFPGGKIEPDESPQQALRRELREELGIEVEVGWRIGRGEEWTGEREIHLDCYWVRALGPSPTRSTDHDLLEWVARGELGARRWAGPDVPIVERIVAGAVPRFGRS